MVFLTIKMIITLIKMTGFNRYKGYTFSVEQSDMFFEDSCLIIHNYYKTITVQATFRLVQPNITFIYFFFC